MSEVFMYLRDLLVCSLFVNVYVSLLLSFKNLEPVVRHNCVAKRLAVIIRRLWRYLFFGYTVTFCRSFPFLGLEFSSFFGFIFVCYLVLLCVITKELSASHFSHDLQPIVILSPTHRDDRG